MAKISISIPDELIDAVRALAEADSTTVSGLAVRGMRRELLERAADNHRRRLASGLYPGLDLFRARRVDPTIGQLKDTA